MKLRYCGVGIENGWMAHVDFPGQRCLDVYQQMDHYSRWESDLELVKELGVNAIRYSVPWYRSNPERSRYSWDWIERPLNWLVKNRITPIVDLIHYGTPTWLSEGIGNPDFPQRFADYAAAFADHFRGLVDHYTPMNEPQISAKLSGEIGVWPPYHHDLVGWRMLVPLLAKAITLSTIALRDSLDSATLISAECSWSPTREALRAEFGIDAGERGEDELLLPYGPSSLAYGRVKPGSALAKVFGVTEPELLWFNEHAQTPDILGVNYYPFGWPEGGSIEERRSDLVSLCETAASTFCLPIYITETSGGLTVEQKISWIGAVQNAATQLLDDGVDLVGVNWWPLYETIQWDYRENGKPIQECIVPGGWNNGLCTIDSSAGDLRRVKTQAYDEYRKFAEMSLE